MDTSTPQPRDPSDTSLRAEELTSVLAAHRDARYAGLNRKQRRHAEAAEMRAARKGLL